MLPYASLVQFLHLSFMILSSGLWLMFLFNFTYSQFKDYCLSATTASCSRIVSLILMSCPSVGSDAEGKGCVFTYDAVGSYERVGYGNQRTGSTLIMPFLDSQLKSPSPLLLPAQDAVTPLVKYEAVDLVKTVFASATERDIYIILSCVLLRTMFHRILSIA
ncbi:proteasome subunit beta type-1-like isoform X2 [Durio zibethinus]|uniref:Proteasome subunit beta type-1-like isoform X2 n=1 Tax=Durio zibethinus TaxID=66656 RepID=A0A6P5YEC5_DURZI|nr:proteasome subunit beta type-1-like isoform X2 [Durio zibethinus]